MAAAGAAYAFIPACPKLQAAEPHEWRLRQLSAEQAGSGDASPTQERSSGWGSAGSVSVTSASLIFSGPTGLIAVLVGLTVMRAGAMLRPCARSTASVINTAHSGTASAQLVKASSLARLCPAIDCFLSMLKH